MHVSGMQLPFFWLWYASCNMRVYVDLRYGSTCPLLVLVSGRSGRAAATTDTAATVCRERRLFVLDTATGKIVSNTTLLEPKVGLHPQRCSMHDLRMFKPGLSTRSVSSRMLTCNNPPYSIQHSIWHQPRCTLFCFVLLLLPLQRTKALAWSPVSGPCYTFATAADYDVYIYSLDPFKGWVGDWQQHIAAHKSSIVATSGYRERLCAGTSCFFTPA
jgi:hypothetical protein